MRLGLRGKYRLKVYRDGALHRFASGSNTVVIAGEERIAALCDEAQSLTKPRYLAMGDGGNQVMLSEIALEAEWTGGTYARPLAVTGTSGNELNLSFNFVLDQARILREGGIFTDLTGPAMIARFLISEANLTTGDVLDFAWSLEFTGEQPGA